MLVMFGRRGVGVHPTMSHMRPVSPDEMRRSKDRDDNECKGTEHFYPSGHPVRRFPARAHLRALTEYGWRVSASLTSCLSVAKPHKMYDN